MLWMSPLLLLLPKAIDFLRPNESASGRTKLKMLQIQSSQQMLSARVRKSSRRLWDLWGGVLSFTLDITCQIAPCYVSMHSHHHSFVKLVACRVIAKNLRHGVVDDDALLAFKVGPLIRMVSHGQSSKASKSGISMNLLNHTSPENSSGRLGRHVAVQLTKIETEIEKISEMFVMFVMFVRVMFVFSPVVVVCLDSFFSTISTTGRPVWCFTLLPTGPRSSRHPTL